MTAPTRFRIGLVQMRCGADPAANLDAAVDAHPRGGGAAARRSSACPSSSARSTSASARTPRCFDLAEPIPGPTTEALARASRASCGVVDRRVALRAARGGRLPQHRRRARRRRRAASAATARCTSRTTRSTTRSSTSRPATSASARSTRASARIGTLVCWDQWYPEAARLTALAGRRRPLLPDGHRLAPEREGGVRRGAARRLADDAARRTPSPTASTSPR